MSKIKADTTSVFIGYFFDMKLQELSQEELIAMLINLYNNYRLLSIDYVTLSPNNDYDLERERLTKAYINQILTDGIDKIILRYCSSIIGD